MALFSVVCDSFSAGLHSLRSVSFVADQALKDIDFTKASVSGLREADLNTIDDVSEIIFEEGLKFYVDDGFFEPAIVGRLAVRAFDHHLTDDGLGWDGVRVEVSGGKVKYITPCGTQFGWGMVPGADFRGVYRFWVFCPCDNPLKIPLEKLAAEKGWDLRHDLEADFIVSETAFPFQSKM